MRFTKLHESITKSSIWMEPAATVKVWIWMLATADETGTVVSSRKAAQHACAVTPEEFEAAIAVIEGPDPDSKSPDHEGRRALKVQGGWWLVNYAQYRDRETDLKLASKERVRRHRAKKKAEAEARDGVTPCNVTPVTGNAGNVRERNISLEGEEEGEGEGELEQRRARAPKSPASRSTRRKSKPPPANALAIAQYLYDAIMEHSPEAFAGAEGPAMARKMEGWARALDLAMRKDGATESQLRQVIDYAHRGPKTFWRPNIMSGKKLREQRTRLLVEMKAQGPPRQQRGQPTGVTEEAIDAASALLGVTWSDQ